MIIECIKCNKKFEVNSELIPADGRTIQCGSCNHIWFYKNEIQPQKNISEAKKNEDILPREKRDLKIKIPSKKVKNKDFIEYKANNSISINSFLRYICVFIISFVALILLLDTFKLSLSNFFPNLELILYNLYETIKDIILFIKDLR